MTNAARGIVEKNVSVIVDDEQNAIAGELTYWSLSGPIDREALRKEWLDLGLDTAHLPDEAKDGPSLRQAMLEWKDRRTNVEHLKDGGWAVVKKADKEDEEGHDVEHRTLMRVWLEKDEDSTRIKFAGGTPDDHQKVREAFRKHKQIITSSNLSVWLVKQVYRLDSTSLKRTGSVYFVLPDRVQEWHDIVEAISSCSSHAVYGIKAFMNDEGAARAILDSIVAEAEAEIAKVQTMIDEKKQGARGLKNKRTEMEQLEAKLKRYEALLDTRLDGIRSKLDVLDDNIGLALLDLAKDKKDAAA